MRWRNAITVAILNLCLIAPAYSQDRISRQPAPAPEPPNVFAEQFYIPSAQRFDAELTEIQGFLFVEKPGLDNQNSYAIVTDFGDNVIRSRQLPQFKSPAEIRSWIKENLATAKFEGSEIRRLEIPDAQGNPVRYYWVGQKSFKSVEAAKGQIAMVKTMVESQGGDFVRMVSQAAAAMPVVEEEPVVEVKSPAQYEREEKLMLRFLDQLDVGNSIFGPLQGTPSGEPITWQSFSESTWRNTNLEHHNFNNVVGYWTNRMVFKGIRFPLNTVDAFIEATPSVEAVGIDYKSKLDLFAGLEWRPFARNTWLSNFRPWSLPLLDFVKNYRFYVMYGDRRNLKDEIADADDYDLIWGVQVFYEWGIDLPGADEGAPTTVADYIRKYVWGEYFGNYRVEKTNFSSLPHYDGLLLNSSVILGFHLPGIPLPPNPINDEFALMPYMRFEHVNSDAFSFPYQNRYFVAAGLRWMPFRNYRFKENEWLSKTKIFFEYVGIGDVQNAKQDGEAPNAVTYDYRIGLSFSSRRF